MFGRVDLEGKAQGDKSGSETTGTPLAKLKFHRSSLQPSR